jgi:hypothetical protein
MRRFVPCLIGGLGIVSCGTGGGSDLGATRADGAAGNGGVTTASGGKSGSTSAGGVSGKGGNAAGGSVGGSLANGGAAGATSGASGMSGTVGVGGTTAGNGGKGGSGGLGGAAGSSAVGGSGGVGVGGMAGMTAVSCSSYPGTPCDASLCGNGMIDTCTYCDPTGAGGGPLGGGGPPPPGPMGGGGFCSTSTEPCDGTNVGGATCTSLGYFAGAVACSAACAIDDGGCESCAPPSATVPACTATATPGNALRVALAATADTIALAWTDASIADTKPRTRITLFSSDLAPLMTTAPFGPPGAIRVAIVPTSIGWLVAAEGSMPSIEVHAVDPSGVTQLAATVPAAFDPMLAARPEGPLLAWIDTSSQPRVSLLAPTGVAVTAPTGPSLVVAEPEYGSAVFAGDAFVVATRGSGASIFRVGLDGAVSPAKSPVGGSTEYPQIALVGGELRMTYADFGANPVGVRHVRLDPTGAKLSPPTVVANAPEEYNVAPLVPDEVDGGVFGVFSGYTGGTGIGSHVDVRRLDASGATTSLVHVAKSPSVRSYRIVRRGPEIIVAWMGAGCGRVGLARVVP